MDEEMLADIIERIRQLEEDLKILKSIVERIEASLL